jgi:dTDP-4-amino-4,6-dideoxygalactose transaminase
MKIPLARPWFDEADERAVVETLRSGWVGQGPKVATFERRFAKYTGSPYATAVSSCTAALHLAALAAGWGPGDEVLVPAFTWISTPNAAEYTGATPVFCDVDPVTLNLDPEDARRRVTDRTRGIIPVHLFGLAADMISFLALAREHQLVLVEDAACALGSYVGQRHAGTLGEIGCFSFHPRKSITTGEGGMLVTHRQKLDIAFRSLRDIGADRENLTGERAAQQQLPDFPVLGFNYRLTDLQAALGLTQLEKFTEILQLRRDRAQWYCDRITRSALNDWLLPPPVCLDREHAYQSYVCRLRLASDNLAVFESLHARRNRLMQRLLEVGVATRPGTHAPHLLSYYQKKYRLCPQDYPQAWQADWLTLALPLYPQMTEAEQEHVSSRLESVWDSLPQ